ncbi:phosphate signaling complex protein PhoU [Uliginosibacterium sp. H3]|uniref:Phosphate-specific transport system accessory protein PhoU n=1 Tax=Uliginosibacterium silvisoli TaxID=3114758 RepID=A0ABU6K540_9RHOO|nr:phosphate signaling complex protein PhoU [Uliginosibacterium sp. H3]
MTDHTVRQYDVELESIRTRVLQMGGYVELQVVKALEGLVGGDLVTIERVIENDKRVNELEVELDEACAQIIAKRQPAATDLRSILAVSKVVTDLERIGDEAKKIAKVAKSIHTPDAISSTPRVQLQHMGNLAIELLRKSLDSMARLDLNAAAEVVKQDKEVDAEFKAVMRQLITFMMEDPRTISRSIDILFAAKALERVGDHAKNCSQHVVFLVCGRDVRHLGVEEMQREVASNA